MQPAGPAHGGRLDTSPPSALGSGVVAQVVQLSTALKGKHGEQIGGLCRLQPTRRPGVVVFGGGMVASQVRDPAKAPLGPAFGGRVALGHGKIAGPCEHGPRLVQSVGRDQPHASVCELRRSGR